MNWLTKLIGVVTATKSVSQGLSGALGDVVPQQAKDIVAGMPGVQDLRDFAGRMGVPGDEWLNRAQSALDAVPKDVGGFIEQDFAILRDILRIQ